jgi:hypothetical protein
MENGTPKELKLDDLEQISLHIQQIEKLENEVSFLKSEIVRKDNNWIKSWQEMQARFNDKVAEVKLLREIVEAKQKELKYA